MVLTVDSRLVGGLSLKVCSSSAARSDGDELMVDLTLSSDYSQITLCYQ